jgi:hypothetical protein
MKLIGDPDQHGPVETGGVFRHLVEAGGESVVSLWENNRQLDADERLAIEEYRAGQVAAALARYDDAGKIVRAPTAGQCFDAMAADWFVARNQGCSDPMIAGPNSTRRALNARARALLKADGTLNGPAVGVHGREFMVGDWVVARRNDRRLRAGDGGPFVKNGSAGIVAEVDTAAGELVVDFAAEGRIRVPRSYLNNGWMDHGYARTTYGVQGKTLDETHYHPGDQSRFEEGYVAITRDRRRTRLYVVDGHLADEDLGHDGHETRRSGLDTVSAALEQRRARSLAHDTDGLAAARAGDRHRDLRSLRLEREALESVLAAAPASSAETLAAAQRHRDALLARRQLWAASLEAPETSPPARWRRRSEAGTDQRAAEREIIAADRALAAITATITHHERRQAHRVAFLAEHADDVARHDLLRRAEAAREVQVRTAALDVVPDDVVELLGDRPTSRPELIRWEAAVAEIAVYRERYGEVDPLGEATTTDAIRARPTTAAARQAWHRMTGMIEQVRSGAEPTAAQPDLPDIAGA